MDLLSTPARRGGRRYCRGRRDRRLGELALAKDPAQL